MRYALLTIGLTALGLGGCVQGNTVDPEFGVALRQNIAAQIADPAPRYVRADPPASDCPRTALAQQRYEKGTVIQPVVQSTSTVTSNGGGGSGVLAGLVVTATCSQQRSTRNGECRDATYFHALSPRWPSTR